MRIAVSADTGSGLDSPISPHFGRCPYYVLVDLDDRNVLQVTAVENPYYVQHVPGAVPGFIHSQDVDVMLTGGMGQRAIALFQQYSIEPVTGASGQVRHGLEQYLGGQLQGAAPCRESSAHDCQENPARGGYEQDEAGRLREEAEMLQQQLAQVVKRIDQLTTGS